MQIAAAHIRFEEIPDPRVHGTIGGPESVTVDVEELFEVLLEPVAWEQNAEVVAGWDVRGRMALDPVSSDRLHGLTKEEVEAMLGPGTDWDFGAKSLSFSIEGAGSRFDECDGYLVIHLDDSGRVSTCEIKCRDWW